MKALSILILLSAGLGFCGDVVAFKEIEERGGWEFETARLEHGVRLNRRTWIEDRRKITYDVFIGGKHLWCVDFDQNGAYFTPVLVNASEHARTHLDTSTKGKYLIDLLTPGGEQYIGCLTLEQTGASVSVANDDELKLRIERFEWNHTTLYDGPSFSDPEAVFAPRGSVNHSKGEQAGAGQPATRSESDSEGSDKPQPEAEGRSR